MIEEQDRPGVFRGRALYDKPQRAPRARARLAGELNRRLDAGVTMGTADADEALHGESSNGSSRARRADGRRRYARRVREPTCFEHGEGRPVRVKWPTKLSFGGK